MTGALYEPDGDVLVPTAYTRGPWSREHQHAGPPSALLGHAIEAAAGIEDGYMARIAVDILRPVPIAPLRLSATVLRPGRRVELLEAHLATAADGNVAMRATAWRMRRTEVDITEDVDPPPAPPHDLEPAGQPRFFADEIAYHAALEWRFAAGAWNEPGPAVAWTRPRVPLIAGEQITPLEHLLVMGDAASGVSAVLDWRRFVFINVDFNVHLERPPEGEWLYMDATTRLTRGGAGLTTSILGDARGRAGISTQSLLVDSR